MTDRELLELAAKAAGIAGHWVEKFPEDGHPRYSCGIGKASRLTGLWNPLTDGGDALRLAVKSGLDVRVVNGVAGWTDADAFAERKISVRQPHNGDGYAATRRAIVLAAAEIGRSK